MDSSVSGSNRIDIFEIYRRYCDIVSGNGYACREQGCRPNDKLQGVKYSSEALAQLLKLVELRAQTSDRSLNFDDLFELMSRLNLMVDSCEFTCFYEFVFFMYRENGQKNITVSRAIVAWRLVLAGRFRLLNHWCDFVEKNQRHNICEDTWRQVLAFTRCVHEDLEGYDPEGAWPVLIDDFVEHMYRITGSNSCSTGSFDCSCSVPEAQLWMSNSCLPGLKIFSGSKRKSLVDSGGDEVVSPNSLVPDSASPKKRNRQTSLVSKLATWEDTPPGNTTVDYMEIVKNNSPVGSLNDSPCALKGSLSKGFESTDSCLQFEQKKRVYYK